MSKMKDKVIEEQNRLRKGRPATMEEVNTNHDEWWNSLTNEQKQKLVEEQTAMEKQRPTPEDFFDYGC